MARRGEPCGRQMTVAVVGLSGGEREKGAMGVGKSCLCNRFMRPQEDEYHVDHISVLSQSDFSGRVVNNDHFLYWGETMRVSDEGIDYSFQVVEQTEFIDDASFLPFKAGKMDPYVKRCCATKIQSAEKLMYICKNQLGIEKEYEQKVLLDGKLNVDGFLCIFDVSQVPNRSLEKSIEITANIINNCLKTKRPVILVTAKNDEANEVYIKEAEKLASRREFKGNVPLVETSSHECINVDLAFMTLALLIDKNRGRIRITPFSEAAQQRKEILDLATDTYLRLVRTIVTDYRALWPTTSKILSQSPEYVHYVDLFGVDNAAKLFRRHIKKLKDEFLQRKVESYMDLLPSILRDFFPDLQSLGDGNNFGLLVPCCSDWLNIQQRISEHAEFHKYFIRCDDGLPWSENLDLLDSTDSRIPFDVLDSNEAETVYKNHLNALQAELEMREMRDKFKMLLSETGYVTPGKRLEEVRVLFMGRESFDTLTEHDRQIIYDQHQKEITEKARHNFLELLAEHAELFYHVKSLAPSGTITQEDIRDITLTLQEDNRYKILDRLENERTLFLLQHLAFIHCPKKEHCPAYPNCMDMALEKLSICKSISGSRPNSGTWGKNIINTDSRKNGCININLVLLATQGLAEDLRNVIKSICEDDEFELDNQVYSLDYRIIDGDICLPENSLRTSDFLPHGIVCTYSNEGSLSYVREGLEKSLLNQLEKEEPSPSLPTIILFVPDQDLEDATIQQLHDEGISLSQSLQCNFLDAGVGVGEENRNFDSSSVSKAVESLLVSIQHRNASLSIFSGSSLPRDSHPDIRVILCMLCGDPYSVENVLSPLISQQWCTVVGQKSITLQTFLDDCKRRVEVTVSSYHGANDFRDELVHGFILVYSTKRKASLATLRAFSSNIPNLPIQILAVTDTSSASAFFCSDISHQLITEGNSIADRLQAHFMTSSSSCQQKSAFYLPFFKEVWDKKPEIERAFHMEDPSALDDSGEGTLERPQHLHHSRFSGLTHYRRGMPLRSRSAEGSSSEIYETVPTDGSLGDDLDEPLSPGFPDDQALTPSDDSDIYSHIENDEEEHLVKPSLVKQRYHHGWVDDSVCPRRVDDFWVDGNYGSQAFTTGRQGKMAVGNRPKPKSQTLQTFLTLNNAVHQAGTKQPGKLNLKNYSNVTDALTKLSLRDSGTVPAKLAKGTHAPLATPENLELSSEYATVKDAVSDFYSGIEAPEFGYSRVPEASQNAKSRRQRREKGRQAYSDSDSEWSSLERHRAAESTSKTNRKALPKRTKKKRTSIPVATPRVPPLPAFYMPEARMGLYSEDRLLLESADKCGLDGDQYYGGHPEDDSSLEIASPREPQSPSLMTGFINSRKETEKVSRKKDKGRSKEEAKQKDERKRIKEEEKVKKDKEREKKKTGRNKTQSSKGPPPPTLDDFVQDADDPIPAFVEKCVHFIEAEGLDSEGIYRVPGNKVHVEQLTTSFKDDANINFVDLDIPVNAAATALKDYLKQIPPLLPQNKLDELTSIASISDRSCRLLRLKEMLMGLPPVNFEVLKFIFHHFVKVAENCKLNSMDSKNLAICWWPTLLHTLQFSDIGEFESQRPHIEDIVQTMIDQFPFLFLGKEDYVMV